jgi:hypothetical protein
MSADESGEEEMRMLREEEEKLGLENELMNEKMAIEMEKMRAEIELMNEKMAQEKMRAAMAQEMKENK